MLALIAVAFFLIIIALPHFLVRRTIARHGKDRPDLPGTGGELARHLLDHFDLGHVAVERTERGDHYDPSSRVVRLGDDHHDGRSISAVAIAAHEVAHAIQHHRGERMFALRGRLALVAHVSDKIAGVFFFAAPVLGLIARTPVVFIGMLVFAVVLLAVRVLVDLVTLPVETDASFGKALPILKAGGYVDERDLPAARAVLRAAAFTYVAGALISLVNLARWVRLLR
jgi:Zn-dependent membrane protease YugP